MSAGSVLSSNYKEILNPIETALAAQPVDDHRRYELFSQIDDELYAFLLLKTCVEYPAISAALPDWPDPEIRAISVGAAPLQESVLEAFCFYKKVCEWQETFGTVPLSRAVTLDYGCGWGRIIRFFSKRVPPHLLFGCDPNPTFIDLCRRLRVPGQIRQSDWESRQRVFEQDFDLIYLFSIFTHASEELQFNILARMKEMLRPGGLLAVTIRPGALLDHDCGEMALLTAAEKRDWRRRFDGGEFLYKPYDNRSPHWGVTIIPETYISRFWLRDFELLRVGYLLPNWTQIPLLLRRKVR